MLLNKVYGSEHINAEYLGIEDSKIMEIDNNKGTVTVDIGYLERIEEQLDKISRENNKLKQDNRSLVDKANNIINQLKEEKRKLSNELQDIKEKTNYVDLPYEALKIYANQQRLRALNLEEKNKGSKARYYEGYGEDELNRELLYLEKRINELAPKEYINALKEIGILEKKIRRLEIDNNIYVEKVGKEVTHAERIKKGYDNVSKSEVTKEVIEELLEQGLNKTAIAKQLSVTRQTIYNVLNRWGMSKPIGKRNGNFVNSSDIDDIYSEV